MDAAEPIFPPAFADLVPALRDWYVLETAEARAQKRIASTMPQLRAAYDALLPRMEAIFAHLDTFAVGQPLPDPEQRLFRAALCMAEISHAVEIIGAPDLPAVPADNFNMRVMNDLWPS